MLNIMPCKVQKYAGLNDEIVSDGAAVIFTAPLLMEPNKDVIPS